MEKVITDDGHNDDGVNEQLIRCPIPGCTQGQVFYLIPFDRDGLLLSAHSTAAASTTTDPDTVLDEWLQRIRRWTSSSPATIRSIQVMIHGWNNTPDTARDMYGAWFARLDGQARRATGEAPPDPILRLGLYWPSVVDDRVWAEYCDERRQAASSSSPPLKEKATATVLLETVAEQIGHQSGLDTPEWRRLADYLATGDVDAVAAPTDPALVDILERVTRDTSPESLAQFSLGELLANARRLGGRLLGGRRTALGDFQQLLSCIAMKNRADVIGRSAHFQRLLQALTVPGCPLHLMAHSFGCKLLLSGLHQAVGAGAILAQVRSVVLIQAAVSRWSFSRTSPTRLGGRTEMPGAYRTLLGPVPVPITVVFSPHDWLLRYAYAAVFFPVPNALEEPAKLMWTESVTEDLYSAALGAFGPEMDDDNPEATNAPVEVAATCPVPVSPAVRILGIRGQWSHEWNGDPTWCQDQTAAAVWYQMSRCD